MLVEVAARTIGALRVEGPASIVVELEARARAINPAIELDRASGKWHSVTIGARGRDTSDVRVVSAGWWAGVSDAEPTDDSANALGACLAGVIAFGEFFKLAYAPLLGSLGPRPAAGPGWSLLDYAQRAPSAEDLVPLRSLHHPPAALVGCGAIGQAAAYVLGHLSHVAGSIDLVDPQTVSLGNLQRYLGTSVSDAESSTHKVKLAGLRLTKVWQNVGLHVVDWAGYRLARRGDPELVLSALDSAQDRRQLQLALPRAIINAWTRVSECGITTHVFDSDRQCLQCTYLPRTPGGASSDMQQIIAELGLDPIRVVHLLAGAPLTTPDLRAIESRRGLSSGALERWRGESVRPLFGHLCGMAEVRGGVTENYVVPLPHVSAFAGTLLAAQFVHLASGHELESRPIELSVLRGPGDAWLQAPALKTSHPAPCICKDEIYLARFRDKWASRSSPGG